MQPLQENQPLLPLKSIYWQIAKGFSPLKFGGENFFIKHLTIKEEVALEEFYQNLIEKYRLAGVLSEAEKLEEVKKSGDWTVEEESKIKKLDSFIQSLKKTKSKMILGWQIAQIEKQIQDTQKEIVDLKIKRLRLIGYTREAAASNKREEFLMFITLFRDEALTIPAYSEEDWDYLEMDEIKKLTDAYSQKLDLLSTDNLKKIVMSNSFFNSINVLGDDFWRIFGRQPIDFTVFQEHLLSLTSRARSIFKNVPDIPPDCLEDYDKLIDFSEKSASGKKKASANHSKNNAYGAVGASKEDLERMGVNTMNATTPFEMLRKSGKTSLNRKDFAQA